MGRTCGEPDEIKKNTHPKNFYRSFSRAGNPTNKFKMCPGGFSCKDVVVVHKGHHYEEPAQPGKISKATFTSTPHRPGVCGCGRRFWKGGWNGGVCSSHTWEEMALPDQGGGGAAAAAPGGASASANASGAGRPGETKVHAELRHLLEGLSVLQDRVVKDTMLVKSEHDTMEQVLSEHNATKERKLAREAAVALAKAHEASAGAAGDAGADRR